MALKPSQFRVILASWERKTAVPLGIAGLLYLAAYSGQVLGIHGSLIFEISDAAATVIWAIFLLDVIVQFLLRPSLQDFVKSSWLDVFCLVIPFFRFLRIFKVVFALKGLSAFFKTRLHRTGFYLATLVPVIWFSAAIAVMDAEKDQPHSTLNTLPAAMWWSISTMSTLGFGAYPESLEGRFVTVALMLTGIGLFSTTAGMLANWLMNDPAKNQSASN